MDRKGMNEKLDAKQRKIQRMILGPIRENGEHRRRHCSELYLHVERITDTFRKRRTAFYGLRKSSKRLTNQTYPYSVNKKTTGSWCMEVERSTYHSEDIQECHIISRGNLVNEAHSCPKWRKKYTSISLLIPISTKLFRAQNSITARCLIPSTFKYTRVTKISNSW